MNYTDYRISLDIFKTASQATLPVKQGDTAYRLCITITANGSPYRITEGCYALFTAKKPDGNFINNECTIENNVIYYQLTPQTTAAIGVVECEVILYDSNDEQLATPHFTILVDAKAYNGEDIVSSSEVNMLEDLIEESKAQIARAEAVVSYSANALKGSASGNPIRIDDISPLEHEIAVGLRSKNLFNLAKISDNTVIVEGAGTPMSSSVFATSDYIAVPPNTAFVGSHIQYCTYYDKDKKYVGDIGSKSSTIERALTTPANTHYVRFSYQKSATDGSNVQLEIDSTASAYTPFVDVSGAKVTKCGKNLFDASKIKNNIYLTNNNGVITITTKVVTSGATLGTLCPELKVGDTVTFSFVCENEGGVFTSSCYVFLQGEYNSSIKQGDTFFVTQAMLNSTVNLYSGAYPQTYDKAVLYHFQVEVGSKVTEYEPYVAPTTYTADADGKVSGIIGNGEDMTLTADNGAIISAEYNRDLNKAFAELMQAVAAAKEV